MGASGERPHTAAYEASALPTWWSAWRLVTPLLSSGWIRCRGARLDAKRAYSPEKRSATCTRRTREMRTRLRTDTFRTPRSIPDM